MQISIIAAMAKDYVIGHQGTMPWHLPADLAHFKQLTLNKPIIMGRKTFESIGRPLPQRRNLVISRQADWQTEGTEGFDSLASALTSCQDAEEVMIIGGGMLYQQALPLANTLYLTYIDADLPGDTHFPAWAEGDWQLCEQHSHPADTNNPYAYQFVTLTRND